MSKLEFGAPGIPDHFFERGQVPMTKEEIRILTLAKAQLKKNSIVYDVGAGTGSISVEAALLVPEGQVFAVEKKPAGVVLIRRNRDRFSLKNLHVVEGSAPEALHTLPKADRIIIGGTGGQLLTILDTCHSKLTRDGIIVLNAITLDTLWHGIARLEELGYKLDIAAVNIAKLLPLGSTKAFQSNNPVYIIRGVKR
ncbi:precorrin-6Y C5,15-methyltransferase (decarboxylating) subunit CbiT [Zhaonella formicivorans]|uniref:precorrin-6Y C5,15-methyltransferase (decarboxylating) subunit CbiT n=1 Tax=Zhaonella formicivorans TaxID=2528593 RepID=UPI0010DBA224|nr:precorrin-6Y C5,15-methyltransferase (decarboxylating) subunit CbiT [Zhaonella formicivorans]